MKEAIESSPKGAKGVVIALAIILVLGGYLRASGLFRGLPQGIIYHPDSPKQVATFYQYLQGEYVRYVGSLFYDGYPYGLNRVDEWLMRAVQAVRRPLLAALNPGIPIPWIPPPFELFWWGRSFRVLYGLIVILLVYSSARRFRAPPWAALCGAALYALAPLGAAVSHCVTGDIGVDLFLALALWALALYYDKPRAVWIVLYGFACGMAFAAKYQGAIGLWLGAAGFLLCARFEWKSIRALLRYGLYVVSGFIFGALTGIPAFFINPKTTWRNIRLNLAFIRDYGAPGEILQQPLLNRILYGLEHNLPLVFSGLGWAFMLLTIVSAVVAAVHYLHLRREAGKDGAPEEKRVRQAAFWLAIASFPLVAILLTTGFKPEVQPFHFSYNLPAMAVSVACLLPFIRMATSARFLLLSIFCVALGESAMTNVREDFFWRRREITLEGHRFANTVFRSGGSGSGGLRHPKQIKRFRVEPARIPVFRNRTSVAFHSDAEWWRDQHQLPVPSVPWPGPSDWIFINGPIFPRNDRMFIVPASGPGHQARIEQKINRESPLWIRMADSRRGVWSQSTLVFNREPDALVLGLRSGRYPARYEISALGARRAGMLPPHSQRIVRLERVRCCLSFPGEADSPPIFLVPLRLKSQLGPVWVTVLDGPLERAIYERFGPEESPLAMESLKTLPAEELAQRLSGLRYLEGTSPMRLTSESAPLLGDNTVLAAGAYEFVARIVNAGAPQTVRFELKDLFGYSSGVAPFEAVVPTGMQEIRWNFTKAFVPYDPILYGAAEKESLILLSWELKPDAAALAAGVVHKADAADISGARLHELDVVYPGFGRIRGILLPESVRENAPLRYAVLMDLDDAIEHRDLNEAVFFLHVKDIEGRMVGTLDFPMAQGSFSRSAIAWQTVDLSKLALSPGLYYIEGGLYNIRTRRRHRFNPPSGIEYDLLHRNFRWAEFEVQREELATGSH